MMKCKMFNSSDINILNAVVNAWLADNENIDIKQTLQSESGTSNGLDVYFDQTITIFYTEE